MKDYENINSINDPEGPEVDMPVEEYEKQQKAQAYYAGLTEKERRYIAHGWSRKDLPFLNEADKMMDFLRYCKDEKNISDEKSRKEAEEAYKKISESYYILHNSFVVSSEVREETLGSMKDACALFDKTFNDIMYNANINDDELFALNNAFPKNIYMTDNYNKAMDTKVPEDEIGLNPILVVEKPRKVFNMKYKNDKTTPNESPYKKIISTELEGFDADVIEKNAKIMLADLEKVDPQWMKSSGAFKEMKEKIANLVVVADSFNYRMTDGFNQRDAYKEEIGKIRTALMEAREATMNYLDYKGTQMNKTPDRKNKWMKQFREQPRINAAINIFDKLDYMVDRVDGFQSELDPLTIYQNRRLPKQREEAIANANLHIAEENEKLANNVNDKDAFFKSMKTILAYARYTNDRYYKIRNTESTPDFELRIKKAGKPLTDKEIDKICADFSVIKKIIKDEMANYGKLDYKAPTAAELVNKYNETFEKMAFKRKEEKELTLKDLKNDRQQKKEVYKKMQSDEFKKNNKAKKQNAKPKNPGMGK